MQRFETPPAPPGWTGQGATLIRIVAPLGGAIAWLAPDFGGVCVGYAIRRDNAAGVQWHQTLHAGSPHDWHSNPHALGVAILGPTAAEPAAASQAHWQLVERDPTAATCAARCGPHHLRYTARLEASSLHLELRAETISAQSQTLALGLRLTFTSGLNRAADTTEGPTLSTTDGTLQLALSAKVQDAPRWQINEAATVGIELWGQDSVGLIICHDA